MAQGNAVAVVMDRGQAAYVPVRIPYAFRQAVEVLSWRKWDAQRKHWMVPRAELDALVMQLERAGCPVRWAGSRSRRAVTPEQESA